MTIAPIRHSVTVKTPPERAFALFVERMEDWWPKGRTIGKNPHARITVEPCAGGRWFETDAEGAQTFWGRVLAWEPPARLLLAWQIDAGWSYDPAFETEVELTFVATGDGGAVVTLEHRNLERFGADAARHAGLLNGGWPGYLQAFAAFADAA